MATKCVLNKSTLTGIADAIRAKGGTTDALLPSQMAGAIDAIPSGGGGGAAGGGLDVGCPRIDLVEPEPNTAYAVFYTSCASSIHVKHFTNDVTVDYIIIGNDGSVTETGVSGGGASGIVVDCTDIDYCAFRFRVNAKSALTSNAYTFYQGTSTGLTTMVAYMSRHACSAFAVPHSGFTVSISYMRLDSDYDGFATYSLAMNGNTYRNVIVNANVDVANNSFGQYSCLSFKARGRARANADFGCFHQFTRIRKMDLSGFDFSGAKSCLSWGSPFDSGLLADLKMPTDPNKGFRVSFTAKCTALSHDSLMNIINSLYDLASAGMATQTLTMGATNLAKLTDAEKAVATNKGWTLA